MNRDSLVVSSPQRAISDRKDCKEMSGSNISKRASSKDSAALPPLPDRNKL